MEPPTKGAGTVLLMRHGERVDRVFPGWNRKALEEGTAAYRPYDLNLPCVLPHRLGEPKTFRNDGPITEIGAGVGKLVGRSLLLNKIKVDVLYASPALRCVQTAAYVRRAAGSTAPIRVEPGLFESMGWYETLPTLLTIAEFATAGFPLDADYKPIVTLAELVATGAAKKESNADYHARSVRVLRQLVEAAAEDETVLVVGHAPTLAVGGRYLSGEERLSGERKELEEAGHHFPFSSLLCLRRPKPGAAFAVQSRLLPPLTATRNSSTPDFAFLNRP